MGLFDKKFCDICGEKIGLLGNRKLDDGNLCKDCAKKLSPWFEERRHSTVEDIKKQLAYREANKQKVAAFQATDDFASDSYHVYVDRSKGQFAVATGMSTALNPDIVDLSQIVGCRLDVKQEQHEEEYRDNDGNMRSYNPPRYTYSYEYWIRIQVNSPWFDDMDFKLNTFDVKDQDRGKMMQMEALGSQIVSALTGTAYVHQQTMGGMYNQPMGGNMYGQPMNGGMYGQPVNGGMYNQPMGGGMYNQPMNGNMYNQQPMNGAAYGAAMGAAAYGQPMGGGMPQNGYQQNGYQQPTATCRCDKCGWMLPAGEPVPKFCPSCGDPIDMNDMR